MQSFKFHDLRPFEGRSAAIKRPREITEFSFDDEHKCHPLDDRSLRYYYPPFFDQPGSDVRHRIDLSRGFDTFIRYDESAHDLHLDALLDTIRAHEEQTKMKAEADFLTFRGMMTKILVAPFDFFSEFKMNATWYQGTIYIEENKAGKAARESNGRIPNATSQETMQYWGYHFETLATLPKPWAECSRDEIESRESEIVDTHPQYCSIVRTGIGNHSIIIGGEVDAVVGCKPDDASDQIPYVELKTSEEFNGRDNKAATKFERKLCKFWAQSFLLGVPTIVVGFRTKDGHLIRIEEWKTLEIPNFVKHKDFLKQHITSEGTWTIEQKKGAKEILLSRISDEYDRNIVTSSFCQHRETCTFDGS